MMENNNQNKVAEENKEALQTTAQDEAANNEVVENEAIENTDAENVVKSEQETEAGDKPESDEENPTPDSDNQETVVEAKSEEPDVKESVENSETESGKDSEEKSGADEDKAAQAQKEKQDKEMDELEKQQEHLDNKAKDVHQEEDEDAEHDETEEDTTVYEDLSLEELVALMEDLVKIENISAIKNKVIKTNVAYQEKYKEFKKAHKEKFLSEGGNIEDYKFDDGGLQARFNHSFKIYKQKRKEFLEAQEILKQGNLKRKKEILEELKILINSNESLKKIYDEFKALQEKWRQIGMVPKNDAAELWKNYSFLVDTFFDKVRINRELRDLDMRKNLEAKIELTEKTEELLLEKSITKSFKLLQEYHRRWREIGPVPHDKSDEIWERFKAATEKVNQRRREYYEKLEEEQNNNLALKTELCEKAEVLSNNEYASARLWNEKTKEFEELFASWRKIGPAPRKFNDDIWNRFKSAMNNFYKNKKAFFAALKEEQMNNYNLKLDICKTAEAMQDSTDWRSTTKDLINLQKEWKKIGPVPSKHSDKIWKRFRAACDHFFNRKEEYFKNLKENEKENLAKKKELIETVRNTVFDEDKTAALNQMKELQKQWIEIGQVPFNQKAKINKEFRDAVDEKLNEIGLSSVDLELQRIKERIGDDKNADKEALHILTKEMNALKVKMEKVKSEIGTWENNISLFANSKNAEVIKKEFQDRIEKANEGLKKMNARFRQLDKNIRALKSGD